MTRNMITQSLNVFFLHDRFATLTKKKSLDSLMYLTIKQVKKKAEHQTICMSTDFVGAPPCVCFMALWCSEAQQAMMCLFMI